MLFERVETIPFVGKYANYQYVSGNNRQILKVFEEIVHPTMKIVDTMSEPGMICATTALTRAPWFNLLNPCKHLHLH